MMRTRFFVLGAIVAGCLGACVIGPKQEDPAASLVSDSGYDDDARVVADTSTAPTVETGESVDGAGGGLFGDAVADGVAGDGGDAAGDARDAGDAGGEASSDAPDAD